MAIKDDLSIGDKFIGKDGKTYIAYTFVGYTFVISDDGKLHLISDITAVNNNKTEVFIYGD